jgi:hypothetical protein
MKRTLFSTVILAGSLTVVPSLVRADVTIRYTYEMSSPMAPAANQSHPMVIYMKGNKGVTVMDSQTTIADFSKQQITIVDGARKKYATIAAADYAGKMTAQTAAIAAMMPDTSGVPGVADMFKRIKTTCDTNNSEAAETIQGVQGVRHEVACTMTITMPDNMKDIIPSMGMKMVTRVWSASPGERLRVPGLWQLSGYELWQNYFMNPMGSAGKMLPEGLMDGIKPMIDAMQKDQSAVLRSSTEISMNMPMPGLPAGDTPFMTMKEEMTSLSTELLDDELFTVPADYSEEPFETVMSGITGAAMATVKGDMEKARAAAEPGPTFVATPAEGR